MLIVQKQICLHFPCVVLRPLPFLMTQDETIVSNVVQPWWKFHSFSFWKICTEGPLFCVWMDEQSNVRPCTSSYCYLKLVLLLLYVLAITFMWHFCNFVTHVHSRLCKTVRTWLFRVMTRRVVLNKYGFGFVNGHFCIYECTSYTRQSAAHMLAVYLSNTTAY